MKMPKGFYEKYKTIKRTNWGHRDFEIIRVSQKNAALVEKNGYAMWVKPSDHQALENGDESCIANIETEGKEVNPKKQTEEDKAAYAQQCADDNEKYRIQEIARVASAKKRAQEMTCEGTVTAEDSDSITIMHGYTSEMRIPKSEIIRRLDHPTASFITIPHDIFLEIKGL